MLIWHYGSASALNHPLFGVGLNEWERPEWMPPSIDNFWLFLAVRYGLPAPFLLLLAFLSIFLAVGFKKGLDDKITAYRTAFLITMTAFFMVGVDRAFLGRCLCSLSISDGQRRLDAGCETKERAALRAQVFEPSAKKRSGLSTGLAVSSRGPFASLEHVRLQVAAVCEHDAILTIVWCGAR